MPIPESIKFELSMKMLLTIEKFVTFMLIEQNLKSLLFKAGENLIRLLFCSKTDLTIERSEISIVINLETVLSPMKVFLKITSPLSLRV